MPSLHPAPILIERFLASVSASTFGQTFIAPTDLTVIGMVINLGTAPGGTSVVTVNVSNSPTSQAASGGAGTIVSAYNLWTATNAPKVTGTATTNLTVQNTT